MLCGGQGQRPWLKSFRRLRLVCGIVPLGPLLLLCLECFTHSCPSSQMRPEGSERVGDLSPAPELLRGKPQHRSLPMSLVCGLEISVQLPHLSSSAPLSPWPVGQAHSYRAASRGLEVLQPCPPTLPPPLRERPLPGRGFIPMDECTPGPHPPKPPCPWTCSGGLSPPPWPGPCGPATGAHRSC